MKNKRNWIFNVKRWKILVRLWFSFNIFFKYFLSRWNGILHVRIKLMRCIYLCIFLISLFIGSENSSLFNSWSSYVTLFNYLATLLLIWFLNSSQQTLLNLELLLSNWDRHSRKLMSEEEMRKDVNISWDMNCSKTWPGFFIR